MTTEQEDIQQFTVLFQKLGMKDPRQWAESHVREGIDQVSRATVLSIFKRNFNSLSANILCDEDDVNDKSNGPLDGYRGYLFRMRKFGFSDREINHLIKCVQYDYAFSILSHVCGCNEPDGLTDGVRIGIVDESQFKIADGLYESLLEIDPDENDFCPPMP